MALKSSSKVELKAAATGAAPLRELKPPAEDGGGCPKLVLDGPKPMAGGEA
jgi:hypothetical protein